MIKGGYKIIDFKDTPFETDGATQIIEGIYDTVEASYRKPLLLTGLNVDGKEYNDVYAIPTVSGTDYVFTAYGKVFTIQDTNVITVTNDNSGGGGGGDTPPDEYVEITVEWGDPEERISVGHTIYSVVKNKTWRQNIIDGTIKSVSTTVDGYSDFYIGDTDYIPNGYGIGTQFIYARPNMTDLSLEKYLLYNRVTREYVSSKDIITGTDEYGTFLSA